MESEYESVSDNVNEPESGQLRGPGTNGLYNIVWKLSHYTLTDTGVGTYCLHCSCPSPGPCHGSAQYEYAIKTSFHFSRADSLHQIINSNDMLKIRVTRKQDPVHSIYAYIWITVHV